MLISLWNLAGAYAALLGHLSYSEWLRKYKHWPCAFKILILWQDILWDIKSASCFSKLSSCYGVKDHTQIYLGVRLPWQDRVKNCSIAIVCINVRVNDRPRGPLPPKQVFPVPGFQRSFHHADRAERKPQIKTHQLNMSHNLYAGISVRLMNSQF